MIVALIIPGILVTFFGICYYFIPIGTGERVNFLATIILTIVMFLLIMTSYVPLSKNIPLLAYMFLSFTALINIMSLAVICLEAKSRKLREAVEA